MPWCLPTKKGVASCENLRGVANELRSAGARIGKPAMGYAIAPNTESIGVRRQPGEVKHLSTPRKRK